MRNGESMNKTGSGQAWPSYENVGVSLNGPRGGFIGAVDMTPASARVMAQALLDAAEDAEAGNSRWFNVETYHPQYVGRAAPRRGMREHRRRPRAPRVRGLGSHRLGSCVMDTYFIVKVTTEDADRAAEALNERICHDEDYGFDYTIEAVGSLEFDPGLVLAVEKMA
jgi:hypothetical protein